MKFELKYPDAKLSQRFEFEYSHVTKTPSLGTCQHCDSMTKWIDILFQVNVCSEECGSALWDHYKSHRDENGSQEEFDDHFEKIKYELKLTDKYKDSSKDIIIVVRDQLKYAMECFETIEAHTDNYHLYVWDNASGDETKDFLQGKNEEYKNGNDPRRSMTLIRSKTNTGFIDPNNDLVAKGNGDYIILINSDCKVFDGWSDAMISFLQNNSDVGQVGFWGGHMDHEGRGFGGSNGYEIDYVPGWCFCVSRNLYDEIGLFSEELDFAYCEDADFSLRIKESGKKIYALYTSLVHHYQNKTIKVVAKEGEVDTAATFNHNHAYMIKRWADYIENGRVLAKKEKTDE